MKTLTRCWSAFIVVPKEDKRMSGEGLPEKHFTSKQITDKRIDLYKERYLSGRDLYTGCCLNCGKVDACNCNQKFNNESK